MRNRGRSFLYKTNVTGMELRLLIGDICPAGRKGQGYLIPVFTRVLLYTGMVYQLNGLADVGDPQVIARLPSGLHHQVAQSDFPRNRPVTLYLYIGLPNPVSC